MWTKAKQQRLDNLRRIELQRTLTLDEENELKHLLLELESEEWGVLASALEELRVKQRDLQKEKSRVETQNIVLEALAQRYQDLLSRARLQLETFQSEREWLRSEYEHVLEKT